MTDKNEEPVVAPEPEAPKATFAEQPKSGKDYWAEFAKDLSLETIEGTMDALFSEARGDLRGDVLDRYEGFAKELRDRKRADATARARIEALQFAHNAALGRVPKAPEAGLFASDDYKHAFDTALRTGDRRSMEQFAQSIAGDGTQGGFTVPDEYRNVIIERKKAFGGIQAIADEITTGDGRSLPWPTNDDTSNSAVIASEGSAAGSGGADLVFGGLTLGAYTYDATGASNLPLLVSKELLQDAAFDIGNFVARKLGERLGRKMAAEYATGSGSGAPTGLLTKSADVMTATTLYKALSEHLFQVDSAYRDMGNCRWVMSDTIFAKVYDSVDKQGRPLFTALNESGGQRGPSGLLLGYPVTLDQGAGSSVAFGDIRQGYIIRNVRDIQIDVDAITGIKSRQVAYHAWARTDAGVQDAYAYSVSSYSGVSADAVG